MAKVSDMVTWFQRRFIWMHINANHTNQTFIHAHLLRQICRHRVHWKRQVSLTCSQLQRTLWWSAMVCLVILDGFLGTVLVNFWYVKICLKYFSCTSMSDHVRSCQICNIPQHSARNSPKFSECGVTPEISGGLEEQDLPHVPHVQSRGIHQLDFEMVQAGVDTTKLLGLPSIECKEFSSKATKGGRSFAITCSFMVLQSWEWCGAQWRCGQGRKLTMQPSYVFKLSQNI